MQTSRSLEGGPVRFRVLNDDQIWQIRRTAFGIMDKIGFKVLHQGARNMLKQAGALVKGELVRVPEFLVKKCLASAPNGFHLYDRQGRPGLEVAGRNSYYGTSTASPNTQDALNLEIRPTRVADIALAARVSDALENIDWVMPMGSSQDVPPLAADVHEFEAVVQNTTKPIVFIGYSARGSELVFEMAAEVAGGLENLQARPFVALYPEPISPLVFPGEVVDRILLAAGLNLPQIPGTSVQPGGTAPVTMAGAVAQLTAEALMSLVLAQLKRPGCPCALSGNFGILDMRTALMGLSGPEMSLGLAAQAEVAQSFDLPTWGLAGATDAKSLDGQAGAEAAFSLLAQTLAGLNLIHDCGYMDAGMICSVHQLLLSDELISMTKRFVRGIEVNRETLALEELAQVGPGGHFLQRAHTADRFRRELWLPRLMNRQAYDVWQREGSKDLADRIQEEVRRIVESHRPAPLPDKTVAALERLREKGAAELSRQS